MQKGCTATHVQPVPNLPGPWAKLKFRIPVSKSKRATCASLTVCGSRCPFKGPDGVAQVGIKGAKPPEIVGFRCVFSVQKSLPKLVQYYENVEPP